MQIRPTVITYTYEELLSRTNYLRFLRGKRGILWELRAERVLVYLFSDIVQVVGDWSEQGSRRVAKGVLNIKLNEDSIAKARSGKLLATEVTELPWEDWFIYRVDGGREKCRRSIS